MVPDFKEMNEREEQALLRELMPDFDKRAEWDRLAGRMKQGRGRKIQLAWLRAAAAVLLLAGGAWMAWQYGAGTINQDTAQQVQITDTITDNIATGNSIDINGNTVTDTQASNELKKEDNAAALAMQVNKAVSTKKLVAKRKDAFTGGLKPAKNGAEQYFNYYLANESVCNGTQCPLEICIVQTFKCNNKKPSAVATCNTLGPDESKRLRYRALDKKGKDCNVTIDEIRIKRVSTGETIVLNAASKPSTAEELFSCITGQEKCNILAGIFDEDCNNHCKPHDLTIYNNQGNLTLQ